MRKLTEDEIKDIAEDLVVPSFDIIESDDFFKEDINLIRQSRLDFLANNKVICPWTNKLRDPCGIRRINMVLTGDEKNLLPYLYGEEWRYVVSYGDYWGEQCIIWESRLNFRTNETCPAKECAVDLKMSPSELEEAFQRVRARKYLFMPVPDKTKIYLGDFCFVPQNEMNILKSRKHPEFDQDNGYALMLPEDVRRFCDQNLIQFVIEQIDADKYFVFSTFGYFSQYKCVGVLTGAEISDLVNTYGHFIGFQKFQA